MKKTTKKLSINKETVRSFVSMNEGDVKNVVGGAVAVEHETWQESMCICSNFYCGTISKEIF